MTEQPSTTSGAVRLIFEYDGDTVRLVSQTPVDVDIPRSAPTEEPADHFVESRSVAGTVLARVPVRGAFSRVRRSSPRTTRSRSPASTPRRGARSPSWSPPTTRPCASR